MNSKPLPTDNVASIDLGVNNLVTMVNNVDQRPIIVKGSVVKSINQYYNKTYAKLKSELRKGKQSNEGNHSSKRINRLNTKRHLKIKDYFHKTSHKIIDRCLELQCGILVIGLNKDFKKNVKLRKSDKQTFSHIPFSMLVNMLKYKAEAVGIKVIITEESYTSKASFLDYDDIPVYGDTEFKAFSGRRVSRGMYKTKEGLMINADVNAAWNIMKKAVPEAVNSLWDRGVGLRAIMSTPLVLKVA
jgi:putative transposase